MKISFTKAKFDNSAQIGEEALKPSSIIGHIHVCDFYIFLQYFSDNIIVDASEKTNHFIVFTKYSLVIKV